jgi:hypothetical protein
MQSGLSASFFTFQRFSDLLRLRGGGGRAAAS